MRIRDSKNGVWFIPVIRLEQKYTLDNSNLPPPPTSLVTTQLDRSSFDQRSKSGGLQALA